MPLIDVQDLIKIYQGEEVTHTALRDLTLGVEEGEFVAVMGPSGSGKSTLLHIFGLLDRPTSGRYIFANQDTIVLTQEQRARFRNEKFGFIFQAFHLLPRTSVVDNVMLPLQYSRLPPRDHRPRALEALQYVDMMHRLQHTPAQLSGGEKQRVAIARALVNRPQILFADEPTGNLDSRSGAVVMELFEALHKQGHTIILITHEAPAASYAERVVTLRDGQVVSDVRSADSHPHFIK